MEKRLFLGSAAVVVAAACLSLFGPGRVWFEALPASNAAELKTGERVVQAASDLLGALDAAERTRATFAAADAERFNWHFIPRDRKGIGLKDLSEAKRGKVAALLRASLSEAGYDRAEKVRTHEDILREIEGPQARIRRDPLLYYVSIFGAPAREGRWGWRFEGHHLSLNFTLDGARLLAATPAFFGANPAEVREGPRKGLRILALVEDLAREVVASLDETQLQAATGAAAAAGADKVPDEVPGPETPRYKGPFPAGITSKELMPAGRKSLEKLLLEYRNVFPDDVAATIEEELRAGGLDGIHFAWAGGVKPGEPHSYLIHGPAFVINYVNLQNNGNHIHSSFRLLKKDFALEPEAAPK
jgi:hypothetical protein